MKSFHFSSSKLGKYAWILAVIFIILPIVLVAFAPNTYNSLVQVLFDMVIFGASLWFGVSISEKEAEKRATDKWLVAAANACMELAAMRESVKRRGLEQDALCNSIEEIVPGIPRSKLKSVSRLVGSNCHNCATQRADLQNRIENIRQSYSVFVNANCSETECATFHELFDRRAGEIERTFEDINSEKP